MKKVVEDNEKGDEDVLYGEEEVLSVCGKGKSVPPGVCERYSI
jgi:hypothetical protein